MFWDFSENAADSARSAPVDDTGNEALTLRGDVHHDGNGVAAKGCKHRDPCARFPVSPRMLGIFVKKLSKQKPSSGFQVFFCQEPKETHGRVVHP